MYLVCKYVWTVWRYIHAKVGMKYVGVQICTYACRKTLNIELCIYVSMCLCLHSLSTYPCISVSTHLRINASVY